MSRALTLDQRALVQALLRKHDIRDVVAMLGSTVSGASISYGAVDAIRAGMVTRGEIAPRSSQLGWHKGLDPDDPGILASAGDVLFDARMGSERLLERQIATGQFFGTARARWLARHDIVGMAA